MFGFMKKTHKYSQKMSDEWIYENIKEINKLIDAYEAELLENENSDVKYSIDVSAFEMWEDEFDKPSFNETLLLYISDKGMTNKEFYKAARLDRKLFSAIKNNSLYHPSKETAIACCFGLHLSLKEAERLLDLAGYSLSYSIISDRIIRYCLEKNIYDLDSVNDLLYFKEQKCIGC